MKIYVDADGVQIGRLGSFVAKKALEGDEVIVLNSEKAIISGKKENVLNEIINWKNKGGKSLKGPKVSRYPHLLLKRMIRGMLPWDKTRGREAYKRIKCFLSGDVKADGKIIKLDTKKPLKFVQLNEICKLLG
ncbi:MAG: uL13 family ribosomal protein [Candidatus Pacearchaeota archaeon]